METEEQRKARILENRRRGAEKARAKRNAKYTPEQLKEFSSLGGKMSSGKWTKGDERASLAGIKSGRVRGSRNKNS